MTDRHPIVGAWNVTVDVPVAHVHGLNLATLAADGTVAVAFPSPTPAAPGQGHRLEFWTTALGSWQPTADGAAMTFVTLGVDENGNPVGSHTISATVTVDPNGQAWRGPFRIAITGADGAAAGSVEGTVAATRIAPA